MNQPKYKHIAHDLRQKILGGTYKLTEPIPTEQQLQVTYDVSRHTVRQAIALLVNEGYLRSEKGSGTYVDDRYRRANEGLAPKKIIGVVTTYLSDYIFPSIIRGIEKELSKEGYALLLASTNNNYEQERRSLEMMMNQGVSGLIIEPTKSNELNPNLAHYIALTEQEIPIVMINATYEELSIPFVGVNDVQSGRLATQHLIDHGHRHIMLLTKIDDLQGKYRMKGYLEALSTNKLPFRSTDMVTYTTETRDEIILQTAQFLVEDKRITAVVSYNDQIASELIAKLAHLGKNVPNELSIMGNDNSTLSRVGTVGLSTLKHPQEGLGVAAAQWMIDRIEKGIVGKTILFEPTIVERQSVQFIE